MPYKIMLVDDEEEVRTSIIRKMDWEALGFHVVGDAENGEDALEKIHILEPDVIITDIHMPYMDGLQLAETVREKYPGKEVVIFSGYNDFEYAKQAIKCGVTEYILKPVNSEELGEILQRIRQKRDRYLEQQRDISILRENYRKNFPILKEKFLNDWMEEKTVREELYDKLEEYVPEIRGADRWIVAMFCIEREEAVDGGAVVEEKELHPVSVEKVIDEYLAEKYPFARFICGRRSEWSLRFRRSRRSMNCSVCSIRLRKCAGRCLAFRFPSGSEAGSSGSDKCRSPSWKQKRQVDTVRFRIWGV